jgi:diguanylate cyclase (GGDEF)-like protein
MAERGELLKLDQNRDLNRDVERLKNQVKGLLDAARHNELVHNRFQAIEFALLAAQDFTAIADCLRDDFKRLAELDSVCLVLTDEGGRIQKLHYGGGDEQCPGGMMLVSKMASIKRLRNLGAVPVLGRYDKYQHGWLFDEPPQEPGSIALLPLNRHYRSIGCLALYSSTINRYQPDASTEFLQRLGMIAAICVENCLNFEQLRRLGFTDALTGLSNRRELERRMDIEVSRILRENKPLSCLYLDVDHFKQVNDEHGHDVGDHVLQTVSEVMMRVVRLGDVVARYGGEEFVIMLPGAGPGQAQETAERIRAAVEKSSTQMGKKASVAVTVSIGIASFTPEKETIGDAAEISEQILNRADQALMRAKTTGRNRVIMVSG